MALGVGGGSRVARESVSVVESVRIVARIVGL